MEERRANVENTPSEGTLTEEKRESQTLAPIAPPNPLLSLLDSKHYFTIIYVILGSLSLFCFINGFFLPPETIHMFVLSGLSFVLLIICIVFKSAILSSGEMAGSGDGQRILKNEEKTK